MTNTILPAEPETTSVRDRVLSTAARLFYQDGIRATGIDRVISEAKVAKASFYHHFPSKAELVSAFLGLRHRFWMSWYVDAVNTRMPKEGFAAVGSALFEWFDQPDFRGCSFINTFVEFGTEFSAIVEHKEELRGFIQSVAERLGVADPRMAATSAMVVIEGAIIRAQMGAGDGLDEAVSAILQDIASRGKRQIDP
jgi:AcrR family transcriptional regulator